MNGLRSAGISPSTKTPTSQKFFKASKILIPKIVWCLRYSNKRAVLPLQQQDYKLFESCISEEKKWLFEKRFAEKYDIQTDELYNVWKKLKVGSTTVEEGDQQTPEETPKPSQAGQ